MTSRGFAASIQRRRNGAKEGCVLVCRCVCGLVTKAIEGEAYVIETDGGVQERTRGVGESSWFVNVGLKLT